MLTRAAHALLYLPALLFIGAHLIKAGFVLAHGVPTGFYAVPYGLAFWLVGRRALRAWRGEIARPGVDAALAGALAALWLYGLYAQLR